MKKTETKITRYEHDGYYIDIYETKFGFQFWVTKPTYIVSNYCFGMPKYQAAIDHMMTFQEFYEIVEANVDDYVTDVDFIVESLPF